MNNKIREIRYQNYFYSFQILFLIVNKNGKK